MKPVERPAALGDEAGKARLLPLNQGSEVVHLLANVIVHGSNICRVTRVGQVEVPVSLVTKAERGEHRPLNVRLPP